MNEYGVPRSDTLIVKCENGEKHTLITLMLSTSYGLSEGHSGDQL